MVPRKISLEVALAAGALAVILLFARAFHGLDAGLQHWLGFQVPPQRFSTGLEICWIFLLGSCAAFLALDVRRNTNRWLLIAVVFLQPLSTLAIGALAQRYFSPFAAWVAILFSVIAAIIYHQSVGGHTARRLHTIFGNHLAEAPLHLLVHKPLPAWPAETSATVLVALPGVTGYQLLADAAEFCKKRSAWVEIRGGTRLLAIFNTPVKDPLHAQTATSICLELSRKNPAWQLGVATGLLQSGVSSDADVFQVAGSLIDAAEALARANEQFASSTLVNLSAYNSVQNDFVLRPVSTFSLDGDEIFEALGPLSAASPELLAQRDSFWKGVILQRQNHLTEATAAFRQAGDDRATRKSLEKLEEQQTRGQI